MNPTPEPVEPASTEPDTGPDVQQEGDFQGEDGAFPQELAWHIVPGQPFIFMLRLAPL